MGILWSTGRQISNKLRSLLTCLNYATVTPGGCYVQFRFTNGRLGAPSFPYLLRGGGVMTSSQSSDLLHYSQNRFKKLNDSKALDRVNEARVFSYLSAKIKSASMLEGENRKAALEDVAEGVREASDPDKVRELSSQLLEKLTVD